MKPLLIIIIFVLSGCSQDEQSYFPLANKYRWEYIIEEKLNNKITIGKSIVSNLGSQAKNGTVYYPHRYANGETLYYSQTQQGIERSANPGQAADIILGLPLQSGTSWVTATRIEVLDSRHESFSGGESFISQADEILLNSQIVKLDDTIEVTAGIFRNCLRIDSLATVTVKARTRGIDSILIEQSEWYAPGVGLIKRVRNERSVPDKYSGTQVVQLQSFRN